MSYVPIATEPAPKNFKVNLSLPPQEYSSKSNSRNKKLLQKSQQLQKTRRNGDENQDGSGDLSWPIIVHCHLAWDWVWQRPQQFISRLSRRHKVLFVETLAPDPQLGSPVARFRTP